MSSNITVEQKEQENLGMTPAKIAERLEAGQPVGFREYASSGIADPTLTEFSSIVANQEFALIKSKGNLPKVSRPTWENMSHDQRSAHVSANGQVYDIDDRATDRGNITNDSGQAISRDQWDQMSSTQRASWIHQ